MLPALDRKGDNSMTFIVNYNEGYEVCVVMPNERGYMTQYPLRNFGDHQGEARLFKLADCPDLTNIQIRMLIKNFDRNIKYRRISSKRFIKE